MHLFIGSISPYLRSAAEYKYYFASLAAATQELEHGDNVTANLMSTKLNPEGTLLLEQPFARVI